MKQQPSFLKKAACLAAAVMLCVTSAFATPTALTTTALIQNNVAVTAGQLTITFAACDNVNGNSFTATGRETLLVQNTAGSAGTFTVSSVPDALGRSDTSLTAYSVAAAGFAAVQLRYLTGWLQLGGTINLSCSAATMKFAVLQTNP
jgi:hypothetical protein